MPADDRDDYEAILIPDSRITAASIWAAESTYTEDGPQTGPITSAGDSECIIQASGEPSTGAALQLRCLRAGMPGINRAGYGYRAGSSGDYFGWDVPSSPIGGFELVYNATAAAEGWRNPCPVATVSGTLVFAADYFDATTRAIKVSSRAWGGAWAAAVTLTTETTTTGYLEPRLLLLPSGRILLFAFTFDDANSQFQVSLWYSDDDGAAWVQGEPAVLPGPVGSGTAPTRLRVAYNPVNGQILLMFTYGAVQRQYASRDIGCSFTLVDASVTCAIHDVVVIDGVFCIGFASTVIAPNMGFKRTGSAFTSVDSLTEVTVTTMASNTELALVAFEGAVYAYGDTAAIGFAVSGDGGQTWVKGAAETGLQWAAGGVDITRHSGCAHRGRIMILGNQTAPAANVNSLTMLIMGGYSNVTLPPERKDTSVGKQAWFTDAWVGHTDVSTYHTDNSVGVPVVTRNADSSWNVDAGLGVTAQYDAPNPGQNENIAGLSVISGAVTSLFIADGTANTEIELRATTTTVSMRDAVAGTLIGAEIVGLTAGLRLELMGAISGANAVGYYRVYASDGPRTWIPIASSTTLTAGATIPRIRIAVTLGNSDIFSRWHIGDGVTVITPATRIGRSFADGFSNPTDLFAHPLPAGTPAYVADGVSIRGLDGPMLRGEVYTMEITHPRPVEAMLPTVQPSPRSPFRMADAAADSSVAFQISEAAADVHVGQDSIGIYLGACNAHHVRFRGYDQGVGWTTIADIDRGRAHTFLRYGHTLTPATSGAASGGRYYQRDELVSGHVVFPGGQVRTITGNTEGNWDDGAIDEKRPVIYFDQDELTGTEATSGTLTIVFPDTLTVVHLVGSNKYRAYQLLYHYTASGAVAPPGGKLQTGVCMIGPVVVLGKAVERRIAHSYEPRVAEFPLPDGSTRTRVIAGVRRSVQLPLGMVDLTTARGGSANPDYVTGTSAAGAEPLAHRRDLPLLMQGLCQQLNGSHTPIVWIGRMTRSAATTSTSTARGSAGQIYGRITGWPGYAMAGAGLPQQSELVSVGALTIREEV